MGNEFPPEEQWEKLSFWQGFYFARDLADALGYVIPHEEELAFVRALAAGEASLEPSPAESIQRWEKKYQREMPETLRRLVFEFKQGEERRKVDRTNQRIAQHYLGTLDRPPTEDAPPSDAPGW